MVLFRRLQLIKTVCGLAQSILHSSTKKSAGIIGDEILKGEIEDTNSKIIKRDLYKLGVKVQKVCVIGDIVDEISAEVSNFSKQYSYVITTGGIGPTHDDVTFEAVAKAFGLPLKENPELRKLCESFYETTDSNHPGMKLCRVPESTILTFSDGLNYPNIRVRNVYMFPGIPQLFRKSFSKLSSQLFDSDGNAFHAKYVFVSVSEDQISDTLNTLVQQYPDVTFGSYPKLNNENYKVKISVESTNQESATKALNTLLAKLPKSAVVGVE